MKPILCIGTTPTAQRSMIFPKVTVDAVNRATEVYEYASGKSLNVARVLQALGEQPIATGFLGGPRGEFCRNGLDEIGLMHDFVAVAAPTRLCTTVIDSATGTVTELVEESRAVEPGDWAKLDQKIESLLPGCSFAIFSGSLPPGAPVDLYPRWLAMCDAAAVRPVVDARGQPLKQAMKHRGAIVKVNREEFAATLGIDPHDDAAIHEAMRAHLPPFGVLAVTAGARRTDAMDFHNDCIVWPPAIKAVNPVGSGDAFAAGLAIGLYRSKSARTALSEACVFATAAAASNATSLLAGDVRREQVEAFIGQIKCTNVFHRT